MKVHPLGKSPVVTDEGEKIAESGAIIEYLVKRYGSHAASGELSHLLPTPGTPEQGQCRFWMHYAEGSLMSWIVMKLVFVSIPTQPMPFFVRPIARQICKTVQAKSVDPNITTALDFIEGHLSKNTRFAGEHLTMADFQMSFGIEAALSRSKDVSAYPKLQAYGARLQARPAYQRAIQKGGPVIMK